MQPCTNMTVLFKIVNKYFFLSCVLFSVSFTCLAQPAIPNVKFDRQGRPMAASNTNQDSSLQKRDPLEDSITISYKTYASPIIQKMDTSISDFYGRFPLPFFYQSLGNLGTAARSLLFNLNKNIGFTTGFNAYDVYNYIVNNTKLYTSTRPFTELAYILGNNAEQIIDLTHTQNRNSNLSFSANYRFINSPGVFKSQNANHNNLSVALNYQSPNKRYHGTLVFINNKNRSSENGGLIDAQKLDSITLGSPFELLTRMGPGTAVRRNPFSTAIYTGNTYIQNTIALRNQYDFGQKDSLVTDSSVIKLYYPRLRLEHELLITNNSYEFADSYVDSLNYKTYFNYTVKKKGENLLFRDAYNGIQNSLSILSFPDKKNALQYLKAGASLQNVKASFSNTINQNFYNIWLFGEYKNKTKNGVWDIDAHGQLYVNGFNSGDYMASLSLQRQLSKKLGSLAIGFSNQNKSPSLLLNTSSSFYIKNRTNFTKENSTHAWATYYNPKQELRLSANYYLLSNYLYFDSFFIAKQEATLFNILHLSAEKNIKLNKRFNLYAELHIQQSTANAPVNLPLIATRLRLSYDANLFTNLFLSTGLEVRYHSNFKAAGYSPMLGQFYYQNTYSLNNRPEVHAFFHFKIKRFKGFVRAENLNALLPPSGYKQYNFAAQQYPTQTLWMRLGIFWNFIN